MCEGRRRSGMAQVTEKGIASRADFERLVIARANADPEFRKQLLKDTRKAFKDVLGLDLPAGVEVKAVEETGSCFYLVLPVVPNELSDEDLAKVAGGLGQQYPKMEGKLQEGVFKFFQPDVMPTTAPGIWP